MSIKIGMKNDGLQQYKILIPASLKARVERHATHSKRSLSQEIIATLEEKYPAPLPEQVKEPGARLLLWLAKRIRKRNPKPGSARDRQAGMYEGMAREMITRMETITDTSPEDE